TGFANNFHCGACAHGRSSLRKCPAFYPSAPGSQCSTSRGQEKSTGAFYHAHLFFLFDVKNKKRVEMNSTLPAFIEFWVSLLRGRRCSLFLFWSRVAFPTHADEFRYAGFLHRNAIQHAASLHGFAVVGNHDELRLRAHVANQASETPHVGFIQWRVDLVQDAERAWLVAENRDQQRQRGHGLLSAGKQQHILQALSWR